MIIEPIAVCPCASMTGRKRDICQGHGGLPLATVNAYRERWGLAPLTELPDRPTIVREPKPRRTSGCGACGKRSVFDRAKKLAEATLRHAADGFKPTPADALIFRQSQCNGCPLRDNDTCTACGCTLTANMLNNGKLAWRSEACPAGKWHRQADRYRPLVNPVRNLIFHVYPLRGAEWNWHWHLNHIRSAVHWFNGKIVIAVVTGPNLAPPDEVMRMLDEIEVEWIIRENSSLGETVTHLDLLRAVQTDDQNVITLRGHTKGVTHRDGDFSQEWASMLWESCLDVPAVEDALASHVFAGPLMSHESLVRRKQYTHFFAGTFYWFRNAGLFARDWEQIEPQRWWPEAFPGAICKADESACLLHDFVKNASFGEAYFKREIKSSWSVWKDARDGQRPIRPQTESKLEDITTTYTEGVTLITPTGDRREAFELCELWMSRQTYRGPLQWIVVDDGVTSTPATRSQQYIRRTPQAWHTLTDNLRAALPLVRHDKILIIEDDEWYHPQYIERMSDWLEPDQLTGTGIARYYWPRETRYREFPHHTHASLCRTGFRSELIPAVLDCCKTRDPSVDLRLWSSIQGTRHDLDQPLVVGMKGMPGRKSGGGKPSEGISDHDLSKLTEWIGGDVEHYLPVLPKSWHPERAKSEKIVIYTVVLDGYDPIKPPVCVNKNVRYVAITDGKAPAPWEVMRPPASRLSIRHRSRQLKIMAHELFPDADWTIYCDGQLQMVCDPLQLLAECGAWDRGLNSDLFVFRHHDRDCIFDEISAVIRVHRDTARNTAKQAERYKRMGIAPHSGLYLGGMLIRRGQNACREFNEAWWKEVSTGSYRDQISLPVALMESSVTFTAMPMMWWTHFFARHKHLKPSVAK